MQDLEATLKLLENGARGNSLWCKRAQGKYAIKRVWLWKLKKFLWVGSAIVLFSYLITLIL